MKQTICDKCGGIIPNFDGIKIKYKSINEFRGIKGKQHLCNTCTKLYFSWLENKPTKEDPEA